MPTITRRESKSGAISYLVQVRLKHREPVTKTFSVTEFGSAKAAHRAAQEWGLQAEKALRRGRSFEATRRKILGELVEVCYRSPKSVEI